MLTISDFGYVGEATQLCLARLPRPMAALVVAYGFRPITKDFLIEYNYLFEPNFNSKNELWFCYVCSRLLWKHMTVTNNNGGGHVLCKDCSSPLCALLSTNWYEKSYFDDMYRFDDQNKEDFPVFGISLLLRILMR